MKFNRLVRETQWLIVAHPQWWLGFMLLALHIPLAWGIDVWWTRAFLLAHYGLFLLWQPFWRVEQDLSPFHVTLVGAVMALLLMSTSWWVIALWLAVLAGMVGGSATGMSSRRERLCHLLAVLYLFSVLLMSVVPRLFDVPFGIGTVADLVVRYGLFFLPLAILFIRLEKRGNEVSSTVDFIYGLMLFLLIVVLVLGSFTVMVLRKENYLFALIESIFGIAAVLVALSWLWNPRAGFAGLGQLLSRYLLSIGLPFERWLQRLAELAETENEASAFLQRALTDFSELPWLSGGSWYAPDGNGEFGIRTEYGAAFHFHELNLILYSRMQLSPALRLHVQLLAQLLGYFYAAKRREQTLKNNAYTQAIYETGARLTHDVKNLLQSLRTLCVAAEQSEPEQAAELQALIQRQLPQIAQRLQRTLDNLKTPQKTESGSMAASAWWDVARQRHVEVGVAYTAGEIDPSITLPPELFDSVLDNLLQNALRKRQMEGHVCVAVSFDGLNPIALTVCDDGNAAPEAVAKQLLSSPVPSESGLGIGLYQATRQAKELGYCLELTSNRDGEVCFRLSKLQANV